MNKKKIETLLRCKSKQLPQPFFCKSGNFGSQVRFIWRDIFTFTIKKCPNKKSLETLASDLFGEIFLHLQLKNEKN